MAREESDVREMLSKLPRTYLDDLRHSLEQTKVEKAKIEKADLRHIRKVFGKSFKELNESVLEDLQRAK
ncbi:hypothetical protein [Idiomarina abyssalis]|uniref:Uncharacterized protein n=1 Tax=Idiomarina abyssalis TaxID=86102 RepID=A0A8I1GC01_9GAMM|nr:hypothetical protein [Idiomarina abyssalis]MBJ7267766.1 hypothetical protein [Idiomarina abyssalis]MBJ7316934.1 hypothetical protein [Idiomarina abyssalis]